MFVLVFSPWDFAQGASLSLRDNPLNWDKLSGVAVVDPIWSAPQFFKAPITAKSLLQFLEFMGDVSIGPNVLCNRDATTQAQNEPSIAVNPFNPNRIIATSNDYRLQVGPPPVNDVQADDYVSFDGGITWPGDGIFDISTIPNTFAAGDPTIASLFSYL